MSHGLPEWLNAELSVIDDETLRVRLSSGIEFAMYQSVRDLLERFAAIRHLLLYFNTHADWGAVLGAIRDIMHVDAVQVVQIKEAGNLVYHSLPLDLPVQEDYPALLSEAMIIDDQQPDGTVRLGALLAVNDDLIGMLVLFRNGGEIFNAYDRAVLSNVASEMAIALNNVDMYQMLADQAEQLAALVRGSFRG